jgi:hypothetical protein
MRLGFAVASLLLVAADLHAAEPVYIDQLMESQLATLQQTFPGLKNEGCYQLPDRRYLHIAMDKKDQKPWRVTLATDAPCRRAEAIGEMDIRSRSGIALGHTTVGIVERLGRPDASAAPEPAQKRLGDTEYFYICRLTEGCARHTSVFVRNGTVTAIAEWYSE